MNAISDDDVLKIGDSSSILDSINETARSTLDSFTSNEQTNKKNKEIENEIKKKLEEFKSSIDLNLDPSKFEVNDIKVKEYPKNDINEIKLNETIQIVNKSGALYFYNSYMLGKYCFWIKSNYEENHGIKKTNGWVDYFNKKYKKIISISSFNRNISFYYFIEKYPKLLKIKNKKVSIVRTRVKEFEDYIEKNEEEKVFWSK